MFICVSVWGGRAAGCEGVWRQETAFAGSVSIVRSPAGTLSSPQSHVAGRALTGHLQGKLGGKQSQDV